MKMVEFHTLPKNRPFHCWNGECIKTGDNEAMDSKGNKFFVNPREQVEVKS